MYEWVWGLRVSMCMCVCVCMKQWVSVRNVCRSTVSMLLSTTRSMSHCCFRKIYIFLYFLFQLKDSLSPKMFENFITLLIVRTEELFKIDINCRLKLFIVAIRILYSHFSWTLFKIEEFNMKLYQTIWSICLLTR